LESSLEALSIGTIIIIQKNVNGNKHSSACGIAKNIEKKQPRRAAPFKSE